MTENFPPSQILVRRILRDADEPLSAREIAEREPDLNHRTVRHALRELEAAGEITSQPDVTDPRRWLYAPES